MRRVIVVLALCTSVSGSAASVSPAEVASGELLERPVYIDAGTHPSEALALWRKETSLSVAKNEAVRAGAKIVTDETDDAAKPKGARPRMF